MHLCGRRPFGAERKADGSQLLPEARALAVASCQALAGFKVPTRRKQGLRPQWNEDNEGGGGFHNEVKDNNG